jgi:hypothetical protein
MADFLVSSFYSIEEVLQAELRRALAEGNSIELLELKALAAKPISQILQINSENFQNNFRVI